MLFVNRKAVLMQELIDKVVVLFSKTALLFGQRSIKGHKVLLCYHIEEPPGIYSAVPYNVYMV